MQMCKYCLFHFILEDSKDFNFRNRRKLSLTCRYYNNTSKEGYYSFRLPSEDSHFLLRISSYLKWIYGSSFHSTIKRRWSRACLLYHQAACEGKDEIKIRLFQPFLPSHTLLGSSKLTALINVTSLFCVILLPVFISFNGIHLKLGLMVRTFVLGRLTRQPSYFAVVFPQFVSLMKHMLKRPPREQFSPKEINAPAATYLCRCLLISHLPQTRQ